MVEIFVGLWPFVCWLIWFSTQLGVVESILVSQLQQCLNSIPWLNTAIFVTQVVSGLGISVAAYLGLTGKYETILAIAFFVVSVYVLHGLNQRLHEVETADSLDERDALVQLLKNELQ